jgi:hypothetical protein
MAHSMETLPLGRLVVAVSVLPKDGDALRVYDAASKRRLIDIPFPAAHGVVWDAARQRLYALGGGHLVVYALEEWSGDHPSFKQEAVYDVPGLTRNGHDLSVLDGDILIATTTDRVWTFDRNTGVFAPFQPLAGRRDVKAVSVNPRSGHILFQQAEDSLVGLPGAFAGSGRRCRHARPASLQSPLGAVATATVGMLGRGPRPSGATGLLLRGSQRLPH